MREVRWDVAGRRQFPFVAYFHIPGRGPPLRLALSDLLVLLTASRGLLDTGEYPNLSSSPTTVAAWRTATQFVNEHGRDLGEGQVDDGDRRAKPARHQRVSFGAVTRCHSRRSCPVPTRLVNASHRGRTRSRVGTESSLTKTT
jgi:hypothetical protein